VSAAGAFGPGEDPDYGTHEPRDPCPLCTHSLSREHSAAMDGHCTVDGCGCAGGEVVRPDAQL
jgi:hypothetical protein